MGFINSAIAAQMLRLISVQMLRFLEQNITTKVSLITQCRQYPFKEVLDEMMNKTSGSVLLKYT